ncbi:unnamed protein product [Rhodiola kirilowii]
MESAAATKGDVSATNIPHTQIRLDGSNFLLWKTLILPGLSGLNLHGYLDGTTPAPEKHTTEGEGSDAHTVSNPAYQIWWQQDQRVLDVLLNSMSPEIATQMVGLTSAAHVWSAVHAMFAAQNRATVRHTRLQLQTMTKKDMSAADYFQKMKSLGDTMASIGAALTDDELIDYILAGLGLQFSPLAASLTIVNKAVSLPDFYAYLLSYESMQEQQAQSDDWSSSGNSAARQTDISGRRSPRHSDSQNNRDRRGSQTRFSNQFGNGQNGNRGGGSRNQNSGGRFRPKCQICRLFGHDALNCHNRFNEAYNAEEPRSRNAADRRNFNGTHWYMDSGATDHLTSDLERLTVQEKYTGKDQIQMANGTGLSITHIGHTRLAGSNNSLILKNILRVPNISKHLLSVHRLVSDNNVFIEFHPDYFLIKDKTTQTILLQGKSHGGLYPFPFTSVPSRRQVLSGIKISSHMWHRRLGHPSSTIVQAIFKQHSLPCFSLHRDPSICDACQRAKSHQLPYVSSNHVSSQPLELIHTDVWGPALSSSGGYRYYVSFIDDYSRFCWVYLIKFKSDVESVFYAFQSHVERLLNLKIRAVQSDGGGEFSHLRTYFRRTGISHRVSCPHTSQRNGVAERKHRHLVETDLALLAHSSLPLRLWDEAFLTACYLINRLPSRVLDNSTPITRLLQIAPDYSFLRTFGC